MGWGNVVKKDLRKMGTYWEGVRGALNWERPKVAWCRSELLVVEAVVFEVLSENQVVFGDEIHFLASFYS